MKPEKIPPIMLDSGERDKARKKLDKKAQGKKNRKSGAKFELEVRKDLESKGWVVSKWQNNVEFPDNNINLPPEERVGKLIPAKRKFNPFSKALSLGTGFPDFIVYTLNPIDTDLTFANFKGSDEEDYVIGVEAKMNGYLDAIEKDKCGWLLENNIFSRILIAKKGKGGEIIYNEFNGPAEAKG
jgi:hypothetical protein